MLMFILILLLLLLLLLLLSIDIVICCIRLRGSFADRLPGYLPGRRVQALVQNRTPFRFGLWTR